MDIKTENVVQLEVSEFRNIRRILDKEKLIRLIAEVVKNEENPSSNPIYPIDSSKRL